MASSKAIPASTMPAATASPAANPRNRSKCLMRASRVRCSGRHWGPRTGAARGAAMAARRAILAKRWQALGCTPDGLYSPAMSRRIAIVEDDPTIRANYAEALRKHGFEVEAYAARAEALAAMSARLPDLALIDIGLGADIDGGFTLCRELRARSAALPIIFLTARDSDFDIVAGLRLGADPRFDAIDTVYGIGYRWKA